MSRALVCQGGAVHERKIYYAINRLYGIDFYTYIGGQHGQSGFSTTATIDS